MTSRNSRILTAFVIAAAIGMLIGTIALAAHGQGALPIQQVPPPTPGQAGQPGQRGQPPPQTGTGFLAGQVVESPSGKGVGGAMVTMIGGRMGRQVLADSQGRFFFANLPPTTFTLQISQAGYIPATPVGFGRQFEVGDGERVADIKIKMFKLGSLAGTIRDDVGDPVVGIEVRAFRRALSNGRWSLGGADRTKTDDRGAYRLSGLPPGDYYVCACSVDPVPFDGVLLSTLAADPLQMMGVAARALTAGADVVTIDKTLRTVVPALYPSSTTLARATIVKVAPGDEKTGIDVDLTSVHFTRVSGTVTGATSPLDASSFRLMPAGDNAEGAAVAAMAPMLVQPDGRFDFAGVPPGQYVLSVYSVPRPGGGAGAPSGAALQFIGGRGASAPGGGQMMGGPAPGPSGNPPMWASDPVTVGDDGASGLVITLHRALTVSGRVEFAGAGAQPTQRGVVLMQPVDPAKPGVSIQGSSASVIGPDGSFQISTLVPGRYSFVSNGAPRWPTLKSVFVAGVDMTDLPITVEATDITNVVITYSDTPTATLTGSYLGTRGPNDPDFAVLAIPADRKFWADPGAASRRFRAAAVSRNGTYTFASLPAGEYFVAVVPDDATLDWIDVAKLEAWSKTAQRVQIADGDKKTLDVKR